MATERTLIGLLLAKLETTYGTDAVPVGASNTIAVSRSSIKFDPKFQHLERQYLDGTLDLVAGVNVLPEVSLGFEVELRGNRTDGSTIDISKGASAQAVEIDCLLQSCDLSPAYTAESGVGNRDGNVIYSLTVPTDTGKGCTMYFYTEKKMHRIIGCKGTIKGMLQAGQFGRLTFEFKGLYAGPVDTSGGISAAGNCLASLAIAGAGTGYAVGDVLTLAGGTGTSATCKVTSVSGAGGITGIRVLNQGLYSVSPSSPNSATGGGGSASASLTLTMFTQSAPVWLTTKPPIFSNTGSTVDSYSPVFERCDFDLGAAVTKRLDANSVNGVAGFIITERKPKATIDPESVAEATNPVWADLDLATVRTITAKLGTESGNKFQATLKGVSEAASYGDRGGVRMTSINYSLEKALLGDTAGGQFQLKFF